MPEQHDEAVMMTSQEAADDKDDRDASEERRVSDMIRGNRRSLQLTALIIILFLINFFWTSHTAQRVTSTNNAVIAKACDFWYPLTSLPVTIPAGQRKPTQLSVEIISGAREGYDGQCTLDGRPPLPPPDPLFARWARYFHVPVVS